MKASSGCAVRVGAGSGGGVLVRFEDAQMSVEVVSSRFRLIRMAGVLDERAVDRLAGLVEKQLGHGCTGHLVIDLGEVAFFGTDDLCPLLRVRDLARDAGVRVHLAGVSAREGLLPVRITNALAEFSMFPTLERAMCELVGRRAVAAERPLSSPGWPSPPPIPEPRRPPTLN
jgi:anti-anti-sigma regulatory factor